MPANKGVRFEDEEGFLPKLDAAGQKDEPEAIGLGEVWLFDLAVEDSQLLTEQSVFGDELVFASGKVSCHRERH